MNSKSKRIGYLLLSDIMLKIPFALLSLWLLSLILNEHFEAVILF